VSAANQGSLLMYIIIMMFRSSQSWKAKNLMFFSTSLLIVRLPGGVMPRRMMSGLFAKLVTDAGKILFVEAGFLIK